MKFSPIELLGIIYESIYEDCYQPWSDHNWSFKDMPLKINPEYWEEIKKIGSKGSIVGIV